MSETTEKLVGIKQVLLPEFKAAEEAGTTKGYMWFVRDNNITLHNYIYLGSRLYGEAEIEVPFDSVITNVISDNSIVVTKTSSEEGTTVELKVNLDPNGGLTLTENGLQIDMSQFVSQSELDKVKDDIKTVNDNLVTSINAINQNVADGFNTINGGIENEIKPAIAEAKKLAVDETERALAAETNLQTNINIETTERKIDVSNLQNNINVETERAKAAEAALAEKVKEVDVEEIKNDIKTVNDNLVTAVNAINKNMADGFNTINGGIDNEIRPAIDELKASDEKSVKYQEFDTNRKTIQLANFDTLSGIMTDGEGVNLAMVSKWDKADFGSTKLPFNMNGSEPRPTYNDTKEVALVEDIDGSISNEADRVNAMVDVINESIKTVNDNLVAAVNTINGGIDNEIRPAIDELKENKVSYVEAEKDGKKYKVIQLDNYANLVGEGTDDLSGQTFNIAMVSKWNKVDLGSTSLDINLNGKSNRPTYNDTKEIALVEDVSGKISSVELVQDPDNQLHYELMVDNVKKGDINIPKDQFLKDVTYDDDTKELVFTFTTEDGEKVTKVNIGELVDTYEAGNGLELANNVFSAKIKDGDKFLTADADGISCEFSFEKTQPWVYVVRDKNGTIFAQIDFDAQYDQISEVLVNLQQSKATKTELAAEVTRAEGVEAKLRTDVDYEHERALEAEANINKALDTKVTWAEGNTKIVLPSGGQLVGTKYGTDGSEPADGATIAQLSQYNVMDFGSAKYPLNLNTPAGVRVTVQEQGQSGDDANKIAYLSDLDVINTNVSDMDAAYKAADVALDAKITASQTAISDLNTKVSGNTDAIANKVDKVDGMGLSQESFTTAEKTKLAGLSNYDDTAIKASIEENKTNIADVRTDLTNESTLQATNYATLTNDLRSEVTRATDREDTIENAVNNIINNGLALQNGKSITAYPNPSGSSSPVEILTITSGNVVNVGSNIGILELESKGDIVAILDGNRKTVAIKEDVDTLITKLQNTIADLTTRIEALEAKNP